MYKKQEIQQLFKKYISAEYLFLFFMQTLISVSKSSVCAFITGICCTYNGCTFMLCFSMLNANIKPT